MSGKELLLSCIVIMHVSFMASPIELETFRGQMNLLEDFSAFCNLKNAERKYVGQMFQGVPQNVEPIEGITFGNTTEEIQASICAISHYLDKHLPIIVKNLMRREKLILDDVNKFLGPFNDAVAISRGQNETSVPEQCNRTVTTLDDYHKKVTGLRIIHSTRRWVETFMGRNISCLTT